MNSLFAEFRNFYLLLQAIVLVGVMTGLGLVPFILLGYELTIKRRA